MYVRMTHPDLYPRGLALQSGRSQSIMCRCIAVNLTLDWQTSPFFLLPKFVSVATGILKYTQTVAVEGKHIVFMATAVLEARNVLHGVSSKIDIILQANHFGSSR